MSKNRKNRRGDKTPGKVRGSALSRKNRRARERLDGRIKAYEAAVKTEATTPSRYTKPGALKH